MTRFLRKYELVIGEPGQQGILITDHQVSFNIEKSTEAVMGVAEFRIFNLSTDTREKIHELEQKNGSVNFRIGYRGEPLVDLFQGNIISVTSTLKAPDRITEVICGDGYVPIKDSKTNKQFPKKTTLRQLIISLIADMNLSVGVLKGSGLDYVYDNGVTLNGRTATIMDDYCSAINPPLDWTVQDRVVNVIQKGKSTQNTELVISEASGLIGSPERTGKRAGVEEGAQEPKTGAKFTALINPLITLNRRVRIESRYLKGSYVCNKVNHTGDFEGDSWFSEVELVTKVKEE